jgi:uncharacterized protein YecT (DUF1311 family)
MGFAKPSSFKPNVILGQRLRKALNVMRKLLTLLIMKKIFILTFFLTSMTYCFGQTQSDLNEAEHKRYLKADKDLNSIYQKVLLEYKQDTTFIKNLKTSQKIWIQFRNAEMKVKYPDRERGYYGSVHPMCWSIYLTELTNERIKTLKIWLDGIDEGDVCSGSVKTKQ